MSEKTELPTPKKIRKAREEGQVANSKDLTQLVLTLALFGYLVADGESISRRMGEMMVAPANLLGMDFSTALQLLGMKLARDFLMLLLPVVLIVLVLGIMLGMAQTGGLFALKAIKPSGKRLNVIQNIKNMFGKKGWIEFVKSCLKITVLAVIVYVILRNELGALLTLPLAGVEGVGVAMAILFKSLLLKIAVAYGVIAIADFLWQRHHHTRQLMMSIDEVRREFKEDEGNPQMKSERKHLHQAMLQEEAVRGARSASVLVTNPIHLAIAVLYTEQVTPLPMVIAKGEGALAARMVKAAREAGVPVVENVPLAWELMRTTSIDQYIPATLFKPMAEVLRMVGDIQRTEDQE